MNEYNSHASGVTELIRTGTDKDIHLTSVWLESLSDDEDKHAVLVEEGFDTVDDSWNAFEGYSNGRYIDHLPHVLYVYRTGPGQDIIGLSMNHADALTQAIEWFDDTFSEED